MVEELAQKLDTVQLIFTSQIDTLWVLICTCLVFLMQGGFMCLEAGITRPKNSINIALSSDWNKTNDFIGSSNSPLKITPPSGRIVTIDEWKEELAKVYYQNTDTTDFTPGNRRIKIVLVYSDTSLNETIGIVKAIGSRNAITVTPISWNNR